MTLDRVNNRGDGASTVGVTTRSKRIQAGLSTQIIVQVEDDTKTGTFYTIGGIQTLAYAQARPLQRIMELGTDGVVGIVPNQATTHTLTLGRMVFDFQRLPQALQREYRHIHAQRRPFNIVITDYNPYIGSGAAKKENDTNAQGGGGNTIPTPTSNNIEFGDQQIKTTYVNCWFSSMNFTYNATDYLITETAEVWCETVRDSEAPETIQGPTDSLEASSGTSTNASVLSAFDAIRS